MLVVDCHAHQQFRKAQLARLDDPSLPRPAPAGISDDEIRVPDERETR
ncbi:MAG: hypothetical protein OEM25_05365 [Gammaproteobacteria bacterium]|nr:hypothetical protein [Gammaproteobacteria bacterium]